MIEFIDVVKKYGDTTALKHVSFAIPKGELVVLKGPSGSGKSTVLSLLAALAKPTSGEVIVDNEHISKLTENFAAAYRREKIGFVFQRYNLIANLTAAQNIVTPLIPTNPTEEALRNKLAFATKKLHIEHKLDTLVKNLSGGEQQRVAIARAIVNDPSIIIADEPTANLDAALSNRFIEILQELKSNDKTIIVATHDPLFFDLSFVDRTIEIADGRVLS